MQVTISPSYFKDKYSRYVFAEITYGCNAQVLAPAGVYGRDYREIRKRESVQTNSPKKKTLEHIEQEEVAAFVMGHLSPRAKQAVVAHLADCPMCRRRVAQVVLSRRIVRDPNESCN